MYIQGKRSVFVSVNAMQSKIGANNLVHFGISVVFVCLYTTISHYHHYADWSEVNKHINDFRWYILSILLIISMQNII